MSVYVIRQSTLIDQREFNGIPIMILGLDEAVEALSISGWMNQQPPDLIRAQLLDGDVLTNTRNGYVYLTYALASPAELEKLAKAGLHPTTIKDAVRKHLRKDKEDADSATSPTDN